MLDPKETWKKKDEKKVQNINRTQKQRKIKIIKPNNHMQTN